MPKANCYELQVDIRSLQEYSEYLVKTSPITIDVPCPDEPNNTRRQRLASFPDAETWNINQSYLQLNEFSFCSMHQKGRLFTGFRGSNKIQIDEIRGQLLPSQALLLVSCFRNFVQQWADAQDFNIPECSTDSELEQSWKRRKVTRSNGKGRASSVHNKSSRHSNDTRTFIRQAPIDNSSSTPYTESDVNFVIEKYIESQRSSEMGDWKTELNVGVVRFNLLHPPPCVHRQPKDSETFGVPATSRASQSSTKVSSASNSHRHFSEQGARLGITQVLLYGGIQMKASSWITEDAVSRLVVTVPNITVEYLSRLSPTSSWFTLAHFETGVVCSNSGRLQHMLVLHQMSSFLSLFRCGLNVFLLLYSYTPI